MYRIIDEPETRPGLEKLIVNPVIILFASFLVPLIWNPPAFGRFWIPALWLAFNGYALGSATFGKEVRTIVLGAIGMIVFYKATIYVITSGMLPYEPSDILSYFVTLFYGLFFLALYVVVFQQSTSYALFDYLRGDVS